MANQNGINDGEGFEAIETTIDLTPEKRPPTRREIEADEGPEVIVRDDTPDDDRNRPPRAPGTRSVVPAEDDDEEISTYTKGVQDRLRQMRWEFHEERRAKESWQREQEAAVVFAKGLHEDNGKLRKMLETGHKTLLASNKSAAESEMAALQQSLQVALETGESGQAAEIQTKLARAAARAEAQNHIQPVRFAEDTRMQAPPQRQTVRLTGDMQNWVADNPWFNKDKRMTALAFGIHEDLIEQGVKAESPIYFREIDKGMREKYPDKFDSDYNENSGANGRSQPQRRSPVGSVRRTSANGSNRVTLTSSEVRVAERLGITPKQYAQEKQRLERLDG